MTSSCRFLFLFQLVLLRFLVRGAREFCFRDCQRGQGFLGEVAAADEPLVVLLDQQHAGEADQRGVVGEDADDVGAAADLAVDALERVRASAAWSSARRGKRVEGEQVRPRRPRAARRPSARPAASRSTTSPSALARLVVAVGVEDLAERGGDHARCWAWRQWPSMSRRKCTVQRCHGQPSTLAIAALRPSWRRRRTAARRRGRGARSERRNSRQNASVSTSPTSRPITSRRPRLVHAVGDHQRLRDARAPRSRTFSILASSHRYG